MYYKEVFGWIPYTGGTVVQIGTWVQFDNENVPLGTIEAKINNRYQIKTLGFKLNIPKGSTLEIDLDGYATEYERKNKINRIVEFRG